MTAATKPDGTKGQQWSIPLSLGQQRAGEDGKGRECWVYDFAVHPDAIRMAHSNKGFERIVVDSALENIERMAKTPVAREYKRLTMKFKRTPGQDKPGVQVCCSRAAECVLMCAALLRGYPRVLHDSQSPSQVHYKPGRIPGILVISAGN